LASPAVLDSIDSLGRETISSRHLRLSTSTSVLSLDVSSDDRQQSFRCQSLCHIVQYDA